MNLAHLHLAMTHLPVLGLLFATITSLFAYYKKRDELLKYSLWAFIIVGITALLAYFTGEGSEEILMTYPGYTEEIIEPHESTANWFFAGVMVLSVGSVAGLYFVKKGKILLRKISFWAIIFAIVISLVGLQTASTGGKLRHTEIEKGEYKAPLGN